MLKKLFCILISLTVITAVLVPVQGVFATEEEASITVQSNNLFSIYEDGDEIAYTISRSNASGSGSISVSVLDYYKNTAFNKQYSFGSGTELKIYLSQEIPNLGLGHFRIEVSDDSSTEKASAAFSVVPKLSERRDSSDSFMGFNTIYTHAQRESTGIGTDNETIEECIHTIKLAGVPNVRELVCISDVMKNPNNDSLNFTASESYAKYEQIMQAYADEDLKVQLDYHTAVYGSTNNLEWCDANHRIPDNLQGAYKFAKLLTEKFGDVVDSVEIWNEPELPASHATDSDGPDRYSAFAKASAIGISDANPDVSVSLGGFAGYSYYMNQVYRNEIKDYVDTLNFHSYRTLYSWDGDKLLPYLGDVKRWMDEASEFGLSQKEFNVNESGLRVYYDEGTDNEMTETQQRAQARFNVTSAIKGVSLGEERHYMFSHGYINENGKGFGTMTKSRQPTMVYSAISALTNSIGNGKYIGAVNNLPDGAEGYIFKDSDDSVICLWSTTDNTNLSLPINNSITLIDMMGNESVVNPTNGTVNVIIGQDIVYLRMAGDLNSDFYTESGYAEKTRKNNNITDAHRIVLNQQFEDSAETEARTTGRYMLSSTEQNTVKLDVYNFNTTAKKVKIDANVGGEWSVTPKSTASEVTVPAMGKVELEYTVECDPYSAKTMEQQLVFSGTVDGKSITRSASVIKGRDSQLENLNIISEYSDSSVWDITENKYIGKGVTASVSSDNGTVNFGYIYSGTDNFWVSPYLTIQDTSVFENAKAIAFSCKAIAQNVPEGVTTVPARLYVYETGGEVYARDQQITLTDADGDFTQIVFDGEAFNLANSDNVEGNGIVDWEDICGIRFGTNINGNGTDTLDIDINLMLKNLGVISGEDDTLSPTVEYAEIVGSTLKARFADSDVINVPGGNVYASVGTDTFKGTYDSDSKSVNINIGNTNETAEVQIFWWNDEGTLIQTSIPEVKKGESKVTLQFAAAQLSEANTTLLAYDVSGIEGASADTQFIGVNQTPILALNEMKTDGTLDFVLPEYYEGTFVVSFKRNNEDLLRFLLEMRKDYDTGDIGFSILNFSIGDIPEATVYASNAKTANIIFAAYKDNMLMDIIFSECSLGKGNQTIQAQRQLVTSPGMKLSVFLFDEDGITPLSSMYSKTVEQ